MQKNLKVVVFQGASVDGRLTISPGTLLLMPDERWQNGVATVRSSTWDWLKLLHNPQATLEGSGSFICEGSIPDPLPAVTGDPTPLYTDFLPDAVVNRPGHKGWFTAVDSRGRIRWVYKEYPDEQWAGWHLLVLVSHGTPPEYLAYLQREQIPYLVAGENRVDLPAVLEKLNTKLGVSCVLSTAGGKLNGALLRAGLVDEINIDVYPAVIGGTQTPALFDSPDLKPGEWPTRLKLLSTQVYPDGLVWLRYEVLPPQV